MIRSCAMAALSLSLACAVAGAGASTVTSVQVTTRFGGSVFDTSAASIDHTNQAGRETANATASAANGVLKVAGAASAFADPTAYIDYEQAGATSNAQFTDAFTLSGMPVGTAATMTFAVDVRGVLASALLKQFPAGAVQGQIQATTGWTLRMAVGSRTIDMAVTDSRSGTGQPGETFTSSATLNGVAVPPNGLYGISTFTVPVAFGQQIALNFQLQASAGATTYAPFSAGYSALAQGSYDLGQSIYWGGIPRVDVGGAATAFTVASASGTNYLNSLAPVPEAPTWLLLAAGLAALATRAGRRVAVAAALLAGAASAQAAIVQLDFSGTYNTQSEVVFGQSGAAVAYRYSITYDTALNTNTDRFAAGDAIGSDTAGTGFYGYSASGIVASSFSFGTQTWTTAHVVARNPAAGVFADLWFDSDISLAAPAAAWLLLDAGNNNTLQLGGSTGGAGSVGLRGNTSALSTRGVWGNTIDARGTMDITTVPDATVAEPGTLALAALALLAVRRGRRPVPLAR